MTTKEQLNDLLSDLKKLEELIVSMRDVDVLPVSFFSNTFDLTYSIGTELHQLEKSQIDLLQKQRDEHVSLINSIPPPVATQTPMPADKSTTSLHDLLEKKQLADFRKAFSLNDRFLFRKELFEGDDDKMNQAISDLNQMQTYNQSILYLKEVLAWNMEDAQVGDFVKLLEKRFL